MKNSKQTTSEKTSKKKATKNPLYIAIALCMVVLLVAIPFLGKGSSPSSGALTTLPLGLLLESSSGVLTVVQSTKDATSFGILRGDIIRSVDDESVNSVASFRKALETKRSGDTINVVVQRGDAMLTINRRYRGRLEVPSEIGTVYSPSLVKTSNQAHDSSSTVTTADVDVGGRIIEETKVIASEWADFGLRFSEDGGRLVVTSVKSSSAGGAYGVEPNDILFQLDSQKITSLTDFQRIAAEKFVGDTASMMLIRGENIVLLRDMVLGGTNTAVTRPDGYELAIYPFASLEREALERLLTNPFDQELAFPTGDFVPPAPAEDAFVEDSDPGEIEADVAQDLPILPDLNLPYTDEAHPLDPTDTSEMGYAQTSPNSPPITALSEDRGTSSRTPVRRFSDVEEVPSVADAVSQFPKPNATPRFNKYSGIRLPDTKYDPQEDRQFGAEYGVTDESQLATNEEPPGVADSGAEFYDGVRTQLVDNADQAADNTRRQTDVPRAERLTSPPNVPLGTKVRSTQLAPAPQNAEPIDAYAAEKVFDDLSPQFAEPVYQPNRFQSSRTLETALTPDVEQQPPLNDVAQDLNNRTTRETQPSQIEGASPSATYQTYAPHSENVSGAVVQSQPCELSETPALPVQPTCQACGDWGCDQCTWKSHNEQYSINRLLYGNCTPTVSIGGWFSAGYYTESNDLFNSRPDEIGLDQAWLFAEKLATDDSPIGFRADLMYGLDANDTQAFGNDVGNWDFQNGFDHGSYGWAIPQLYLELSLGKWNIKAGHFFTTIGYEVVTDPDNFFYSHAMTMYNSEPFTHTGVIASRMIGEKLEIYAGWTLGWDTGFDQFADGSSWLGGLSYAAMEDLILTYMSTAGNFGARGDDAYSHSIVANLALTGQLSWIVQSDYLRVGGTGEDNVGLNQYLLYEVNDNLGVGARLEWWKGDVLTGYAPHGGVLPASGSLSYYEATFGVNYQPRGNVILRPEVRYDWSPAANYDQAYFSVDAILKF